MRQATCQGNVTQAARASGARNVFMIVLHAFGSIRPLSPFTVQFFLGMGHVILRERHILAQYMPAIMFICVAHVSDRVLRCCQHKDDQYKVRHYPLAVLLQNRCNLLLHFHFFLQGRMGIIIALHYRGR